MYFRKISLFIGIFSASLFLAQRSKEDLQRQNAELKKQIETINANLAKAKSEARLSISYLNDINKKTLKVLHKNSYYRGPRIGIYGKNHANG